MLDLLLPRRKAAKDYWPSTSIGGGRVATRAGVSVDEEIALTYAAVWCATRILSETVSGLPLHLYRRAEDGSREIAKDNSKNQLVNYPNPSMGGRSLREAATVHQLNYGNGFAEIEYAGERPVALWPIHASRVRPSRPYDRYQGGSQIPEGYYIVRNDDGTSLTLSPREMLHIPGAITDDGIWGKSVIQYARESIGFGLAHLRHGATSFGTGNMPRAVLSAPGLKNPEDRAKYRSEWKTIHGSPDSGELAIIPAEAKLVPLSMNNQDAQFIESGMFPVKDVARFYRLPMHMLGEYEKAASYASVEMQGIEFVIYSLLPWLLRWEETLNLKLLSESERKEFYFEHNVAGLLRGDNKSRMEGYEIGLRTGIYSINQVCALENLPGIGTDGDVRYVPMNMTTAARMAAGPVDEEVETELEPTPEEMASGESAAEVIDVPDYRQGTDYSCGCAATWSVADHFGVAGGMTEADFIRELGATPTDGTQPENMIDWLTDHGLTVTAGQKWTIDNLRAFFEKGQPVIVPVQMYGTTPEYDAEEEQNRTGHYVVVIGVGMGVVIFQDPSAGRQVLPAAEFDKIWHDVEADGVVDDHFGIAVGESPAVETEGEKEEKAEAGIGATNGRGDNGDANKGTKDKASSAFAENGVANSRANDSRKAASVVLIDTLERMYAKESNAASRAAKGDFFKWIETWESKHKETLIDALRPACSVICAAGVKVDAAELARRIVADSIAMLRQAYDTDTPEKFAERMASWAATNTKRVIDWVFVEEPSERPASVVRKTIERDSDGYISRIIEEKN